MKALGMIEVYGYLAAVEALDSALKAANVNLVDVTLVQGGLVTVIITGEVGAVKAAMDASKTAGERVGRIISVHVIPRPSKELEKIVGSTSKVQENLTPSVNDKKQENITPSVDDKQQSELDIDYDEKQAKASAENSEGNCDQITVEQIMTMKVERLRSLARELGIKNMTKKQIRFATKHELIESISEFIEQER